MTAAGQQTELDLDQPDDWNIRSNGVIGQPDPNNFGAVWSGRMYVGAPGSGALLEAGDITLATASDDGSTWFVDGALVVDNNFYQGRTERSGTVNLTEGWHDVFIGWYEGGGGANMEAKFGQGAGVAYGSLTFIDPGDPAQAGMWAAVVSGPINEPDINIGVDGNGTLDLVTHFDATLGSLSFTSGNLTVAGAPEGVTFADGSVAPAATNFGIINPMDVTVNGPYNGNGASGASFTKAGAGAFTLAQGTSDHGGVSVSVKEGRLVTQQPMQAAGLNIGGTGNVDTGVNDVTISDGGRMSAGALTISGSGADFTVGGDDMAAGPQRLGLVGGTVTVRVGGMPGGLAFHVDAGNMGTLWQDTGGTSPVTGDGQAVARWDDTSPSGIIVSQGSTANQPVYQASVASLNGQPALFFDGGSAGDALTSTTGNSTGITGDHELTVITVWSDAEGTGQNYQHTFHMGQTATREAYGHSVSRGGNAGEIGNHYWGDGFNTSSTNGLGAPNIALSTYDSFTHQDSWWVNGDAVGSRAVTLNIGNNQLQVGSRLSPFTEGIRGSVAEILVFDNVLNADKMNNIGGYLAAKYGIAAPNWTGNIDPQAISLPNTDVSVTADATLFADTPTTATFGNLSMSAGVNLTLDGAPGGFTFAGAAGGHSVTATAGGAMNFYSEDFSSSDGGFTVTNSGPIEGPWTYNSPGGSWTADGSENQGTPTSSALTSPTITVASTGPVTLSLDHRYSLEDPTYPWDGGQVLVSVNGGAFEPIPGSAFTANGYSTIILGNNVLNGQEGFSGDSAGYSTPAMISSLADLGSFSAGDTIQVRFLGGWDEYARGSLPNWEIDNVTLGLVGLGRNEITVNGVLDPGGDPTDPASGVDPDFQVAANLTLGSGATYRWELGPDTDGDRIGEPDTVHVSGDLTLSELTLALVDAEGESREGDPLPLLLGFDDVTWDPSLISFDLSEAPSWLAVVRFDGPQGDGLYLLGLQTAPEPSTLVLAGLGLLGLGFARWRRRRRRPLS